MGTLSDRLGKRKAIILVSYILLGHFDHDILAAGAVKNATLAVVAVIALDCIMTFLGSTANDASFNAWLTNVTDETNRQHGQRSYGVVSPACHGGDHRRLRHAD